MESVKLIDKSNRTKNIAMTAMIFAIALVLSIVESSLPPLPIPVPGVKFGLSNIAVMYAVFFVGTKQAYAIAFLKGAFVVLTRGLIAASLSLTGGFLSISIMILLIFMFRKDNISYATVSIAGAISHNVGQFIAVSIILANTALIYYLPILIISGALAGIVTSLILKAVMPALKKVGLIIDNK